MLLFATRTMSGTTGANMNTPDKDHAQYLLQCVACTHRATTKSDAVHFYCSVVHTPCFSTLKNAENTPGTEYADD